MRIIRYERANKSLAQDLRRNMTRQERRLWYDCLKLLPITVRRQKQFGNYIVDFYIADADLVVELDGSQHYQGDQMAYDKRRNSYLKEQGLKILRFSNLDVDRNFDAVCRAIIKEIDIWREE